MDQATNGVVHVLPVWYFLSRISPLLRFAAKKQTQSETVSAEVLSPTLVSGASYPFVPENHTAVLKSPDTAFCGVLQAPESVHVPPFPVLTGDVPTGSSIVQRIWVLESMDVYRLALTEPVAPVAPWLPV